ncbi:DUF4347 domain-containing protein [Mesorhizobium sp. WSM3859]|uniref:DUF4347 domain-containing protein n=1 Tax=Mesorhizobium sp. WSM3859 TaxID=2029402 RepID=UPI00159694EA|nr:DUF4347 domain-containing protein [Mesorhizobium sp. WSM3859]
MTSIDRPSVAGRQASAALEHRRVRRPIVGSPTGASAATQLAASTLACSPVASEEGAVDLASATKDFAETGIREVVFLDPSVSDPGTILRNLRLQVEAIVLDGASAPARQMATALEGRRGLDAVHVIAHGAPGRVSFSRGEWTPLTIEDDEADLAAIGQALRPDAGLGLWSCEVGAGAAGADFVGALSRAAAAPVAAATDRVGSPALGGNWELDMRSGSATAQPPLTELGMSSYKGVFSVALTSTGRGERLTVFGQWAAGTAAGTYFIVLNEGGTLNVIGQFIVPTNFGGTFAISEALPAGRYTVGPSAPGPNTIAVYNGRWSPAGSNGGTWSVGDFNPTITASLNRTGDAPSQSDRGTAR